jgi:hypothetical protein
MISDYAFFKGIDDAVHLFSKFSDQPTYYYLFGYRGQLSAATLLGLPSDLNLGKRKFCQYDFSIFKNEQSILK